MVRLVNSKILDEQNIQELGAALFSLVDGDEGRKFLLDFAAVEFLSSAALGKLITLDKKVKAKGGRLILCSVNPQIYEVFAITRLNKLFSIAEDEMAALQAF